LTPPLTALYAKRRAIASALPAAFCSPNPVARALPAATLRKGAKQGNRGVKIRIVKKIKKNFKITPNCDLFRV
jgi:hypothetical protein